MMIDWSNAEKSPAEEDPRVAIERAKSIAYLQSTDWYAIRLLETGKEIPEDVQKTRALARASIV